MTIYAGYREIQQVDLHQGVTYPVAVMYPTSHPERPEGLGRHTAAVAMNAAPIQGRWPLVLISHGTGGTHLGYLTLAHHLARHGFIVAMPEHPGNNRHDNSQLNTIANLVNRPRHLKGVIDWFMGDPEFASRLKPDAVGVVGHSMGGYTALAVAGGRPTSLPHESKDGQPQQVAVEKDARVKALVLLAPATPWYRMPGALADVRVPILMLTGEKDVITPATFHARVVADGIPDKAKLTHEVVANCGHFGFMSPFPESMVNPAFAPSQDPAGFDRAAFQTVMHATVQKFLTLML